MIRVAFAVVQQDRRRSALLWLKFRLRSSPLGKKRFFLPNSCNRLLLLTPSAWYFSFHLPDSKNLNLLVPWRRSFPSHFQCESVDHAVDQLQEGLVVSSTTFSRCLFLLGKGVGTWRSVSSAFPHFGQLGFCLEIITYMRQLLHPTATITEISPSPADSSLPTDLVLRCSRSILVASPGSLHDRGCRFTSTSSSPVKSRQLINYTISTLNQPSPQYSFQLHTVGVKLVHYCPEWRNVHWFGFETLSFHKTQLKIPRISHHNFKKMQWTQAVQLYKTRQR